MSSRVCVAALVFGSLFQPYGLINSVFGLQLSWLNNPGTAMYAMSITTIWSLVGFYVVIFMAGFQQISREHIEAARLDGATTLQLIRRVELPLMRPTILSSRHSGGLRDDELRHSIRAYPMVGRLRQRLPCRSSFTTRRSITRVRA